MPSQSVPDPAPYVQWMFYSKDVSAQILRVFTMKLMVLPSWDSG